MPIPNELLPALRHALRRLYDSAALRESPLVSMLGISPSADPGLELRRLLTTEIRALQPPADMPADTPLWRAYEILLYRYVQRCSQLEVAEQLGLGARQLGREERKALELLAARLALAPAAAAAPVAESAATRETGAPSSIDDNLAWLQDTVPCEPIDLGQVLASVVGLAGPLARKHGSGICLAPCPEASLVAGHPVALRQAFLSLLTSAIQQLPGHRISIAVRADGWRTVVQITASRPSGGPIDEPGTATPAGAGLEMARRLLSACGASLALQAEGASFAATVALPVLEQLPVLLIDDHAGTRRLLERYLSGSRYRILAAGNLEEALGLARQVPPQIIVLDVMMPDIDGWELLGRLRQHPLTGHAPVIVCTILDEEEFAFSLGAKGFVRKPVSQQAFLSALDELAPRR